MNVKRNNECFNVVIQDIRSLLLKPNVYDALRCNTPCSNDMELLEDNKADYFVVSRLLHYLSVVIVDGDAEFNV